MLECDGESIEPAHLHFAGGAPPPGLPPQDLDVTFREARQHAMEAFERLYLLGQLRRFRGRITDVAHHAGVTTKHVRELMRGTGSIGATSVRRCDAPRCVARRSRADAAPAVSRSAPRGALVLVGAARRRRAVAGAVRKRTARVRFVDAACARGSAPRRCHSSLDASRVRAIPRSLGCGTLVAAVPRTSVGGSGEGHREVSMPLQRCGADLPRGR